VLEQIFSTGSATLRLDSSGADRLADLFRESRSFFSSETSEKLRYSVPNRNNGYRPHGSAHSGSPDKPDLNDSFLYWKHRRETLPSHQDIGPFLDALEAYRLVAAAVVNDVIESLGTRYGYRHALPFTNASVLQVNSFGAAVDRDLLQHSHEDATLLTVITANAAGLEAVIGEEVRPLTFAPDEVMVLPGSVLTEMTGGEIPPVYHQVRNHRILERKSIMYFVSPDADGPIEPFVVNDYNRGTDIRESVINNPQTFGLPEDFVS